MDKLNTNGLAGLVLELERFVKNNQGVTHEVVDSPDFGHRSIASHPFAKTNPIQIPGRKRLT